jgi:prevent-host-death family protein
MKSIQAAVGGGSLVPDRVGVRELRQNLSVYLERVVAGGRLAVTDRGRPVAMLIPLSPAATVVERLVAEGRATPARKRIGDLPPLKGRIRRALDGRLQRALQELREERV